MQLSPKQKLAMMRQAEVNPGIVIMNLFQILSEEITAQLSQIKVGNFKLKEIDYEVIISGIVAGIKILPAIPGKPGHTPTAEELLVLIKKVMPEVKNGDTPTDEHLKNLIKALMPKIEQPKPIDQDELIELIKSLIPEHDDSQDEELAKKVKTLEKDIELLKKLPRTQKKVSKNIHGGGITASSMFVETPSGVIDGNNKTYTVANTIERVITMAINGMIIHPTEYTVSGKNIIMITALDIALSGTGFTIVYV